MPPIPDDILEKVREKRASFNGEDYIWYEDPIHIYTDMEGNKLEGASSFANRLEGWSDDKRDYLLGKWATTWRVEKDELGDIWDMMGVAAALYGSSVHSAMEMFYKHYTISQEINIRRSKEGFYALPKNKHLEEIVLNYHSKYPPIGERLTEVVVTDVATGRAGTIDVLDVIDRENKIVDIRDYKTNFKLEGKDKNKYALQFEQCADILEKFGWTVRDIWLDHLRGTEWTAHKMPRVDLTKLEEK